jgi:hypothetical protein
VFGTEIEAVFLLKIGTISKALGDKFIQVGAAIKHKNQKYICSQKKSVQYSRTAEIVAQISRQKSSAFF